MNNALPSTVYRLFSCDGCGYNVTHGVYASEASVRAAFKAKLAEFRDSGYNVEDVNEDSATSTDVSYFTLSIKAHDLIP